MQLSLLKSDKLAKYFSDFADVSSICIKLAVQNSLLAYVITTWVTNE